MLLACDMGSTYTKVALLRNPLEQSQAGGRTLAASYRKKLLLEQQTGSSWTHILRDLAQVLPTDLLKKDLRKTQKLKTWSTTPKDKPAILEACSFSSHGPSLIAIDRDGIPLESCYNPIHRSAAELPQFHSGMSFYLPLARVLWRKLREAERRRVHCFLPPANFLAFLLTGQLVVPIPQHYQIFYWPDTPDPLEKKQICGERFTTLDREFLHLFPPFSPFCDEVGKIQVSALKAFGLSAQFLDCPVFCPGVDFFAAEAGLYDSTETLLRNRTGTSEGFNLFLPADPDIKVQENLQHMAFPPGFFLNRHVLSKRPLLSYVEEGNGKLFTYLLDLWHDPWDEASLHCASLQRSCEMMMLQNIFSQARPSQIAKANQFVQEFMQTGKANFLFPGILKRALPTAPFSEFGLYIMQLLMQCFVQRCQGLFTLYEQYAAAPINSQEVLLYGGQAYHPNWIAWKAQHSGFPIHTPSICDAEFIGAAAISFSKLGYFPSIEQASHHLLEITHSYP